MMFLPKTEEDHVRMSDRINEKRPSDLPQHRPIVQQLNTDHAITIWYKMLGLYFIWFWVAQICEWAAFVPLLFNDGGRFYNECYYMFYNGVVWYNPPEPYKFN